MNDDFERVRINEFSGTLYPKQRSDEVGLNALFMFYKRFLHFTGYTSRREYWWTLIMTAALWVALVFFAQGVLLRMGVFGYFLTGLFSIILSLGSLSLLFRRYADAGIYRWLAFIASVLYSISTIALGPIVTNTIAVIALLIIPALPTSKMVKGVVTVYAVDAD